mmetsp:Transcript_100526/g.255770  ORF Transcript_100526/g.255770 Transcript_100526/m.255770 type:complete len:221 (+) Transcript_100526:993-1655(+)
MLAWRHGAAGTRLRLVVVQERQGQGPGSDRRRPARPGHQECAVRGQLRPSEQRRGLRPPHRAHGQSRREGRRVHLLVRERVWPRREHPEGDEEVRPGPAARAARNLWRWRRLWWQGRRQGRRLWRWRRRRQPGWRLGELESRRRRRWWWRGRRRRCLEGRWGRVLGRRQRRRRRRRRLGRHGWHGREVHGDHEEGRHGRPHADVCGGHDGLLRVQQLHQG